MPERRGGKDCSGRRRKSGASEVDSISHYFVFVFFCVFLLFFAFQYCTLENWKTINMRFGKFHPSTAESTPEKAAQEK